MVFRKVLRFFGWGGKSTQHGQRREAIQTDEVSGTRHWEEDSPSEYPLNDGFERSGLHTPEELISTGRHSTVPETPVFFPPPTSSDGSDSTTSTNVIPSVYRRPSGKKRDQGGSRKAPSEVSWDPGRAVVAEEDEFSDMRSTSSGYVSIMRGRSPHGKQQQQQGFTPSLPLRKVGSGGYGRRPSLRKGRTRSTSPEQHTQRVYPIHETSFENRSHHSEPEVIEPVIYEHEISGDGDSNPEMYHYIIPGGLNVVFWNNEGKEITRVGEFGKTVNRPRRISPTIIQDEFGNELYRTGDFSQEKGTGAVSRATSGHTGDHDRHAQIFPLEMAVSYASVPREARNIILIDDKGKEVPLRLDGKAMTRPQAPPARGTHEQARERHQATPVQRYWY